MAALIWDVKQCAENLGRWSRLSGILLLFVFAGVCGAEEMPFKMSSLVLPQGVSYTLGPVTLTRALEQASSANKTGKTTSLQSQEASSTKKTVGSGVESTTASGHSSGYNLGGSIGGSSGGSGSASLMGLLGLNLGGIGGKVSGEDSSRLKSTNHNGTESTLENSRQSDSGSSSEFEEQEQYGSYHLRFTVSFKSKDLSDTFLVGGPNASVILNGFSAPVKVPYTERNEAIRLGAEERILFFDYPIADQVTLQDAKRFAATGRRNAVTLSLTGDDFPVVSERTKHNVVSEITRIMQTIPNTVVSLDFGDVKRLSPWRIRRRFARNSGRSGQRVTIREALEALNEVIAKDEEKPEVAFKFAKDGRLEAVGDTPALASPRKDDLTFIAVSVVTDTHEADTEVHFPTKAFLSRPLSDFTDVRFVQLQLSELVHASVTAPETVKTLREEIESVLPSVNGTEKLWRILREGQKEKEEEEVKSEPEKKVRESASHERATSHESEKAPKGKGLKTGDIKMIMLPGGVTMEMIYCGPDSFIMGSSTSEEGRYDDEMQHKVTFSKGFWLGKYEVTQAQWESVMKFNPSSAGLGEDKPVESVSWEDCQKFIQGVNDFKNYNARLPTEAEWEYACRAGSTGSYGGNGKLDDMGWYAGDYCSGGRTGNSGGTTHSVGRKRGNAWGFHDMHGNVAEWCHEWYGDYYQGDQTDPQGRSSPDGVFFYHGRVCRGGDWRFGKQKECRSAYRTDCAQGNRLDYIGFRLCCSAAACE